MKRLEKYLLQKAKTREEEQLRAAAVENAYRLGWAEGKAEEIMQFRPLSFVHDPATKRQTLIEFFRIYASINRGRRRLTYKQVAIATGFNETRTKRLINESGLLQDRKDKQFFPRSRLTLDTMMSAYNLGLGISDVDYFIGRPAVFRCRLYENEIKLERRHGIYLNNPFSYITASQDYRASDQGMTLDEIAEKNERKIDQVKINLSQRYGVEPIIIQALHLLHAGKQFDKPYIA